MKTGSYNVTISDDHSDWPLLLHYPTKKHAMKLVRLAKYVMFQRNKHVSHSICEQRKGIIELRQLSGNQACDAVCQFLSREMACNHLFAQETNASIRH